MRKPKKQLFFHLPAKKAAWDRVKTLIDKLGYVDDYPKVRYAWKHDHDFYNDSKDTCISVNPDDIHPGELEVFIRVQKPNRVDWEIRPLVDVEERLWNGLVKIADLFKQRSRRMTFYLDDHDKKMLEFITGRRRVGKSAAVRDCLFDYILEHGWYEDFEKFQFQGKSFKEWLADLRKKQEEKEEKEMEKELEQAWNQEIEKEESEFFPQDDYEDDLAFSDDPDA
jgi:hypothetical protein